MVKSGANEFFFPSYMDGVKDKGRNEGYYPKNGQEAMTMVRENNEHGCWFLVCGCVRQL